MVRVGITGTGFKGFERAIDDFEDKVIDDVKRVVAETAEMMANQMRALAPVDDGNLRDSIEVKYFNKGLSAKITVGSFYGIFLEHGTGIYSDTGTGRKDAWVYWSDKLNRFVFTRGIRPQPFFRPSVEQALNHFQREMNKL